MLEPFATECPKRLQSLAGREEHLGELIAYARTNEVVPPWSMGN
jgi:hypothetical protein